MEPMIFLKARSTKMKKLFALLLALSLLLLIHCVALRAIAKGSRVTGCVYRVESRLKERAYQIACQSAQRSSGHPSDNATNPFSCCHFSLYCFYHCQ